VTSARLLPDTTYHQRLFLSGGDEDEQIKLWTIGDEGQNITLLQHVEGSHGGIKGMFQLQDGRIATSGTGRDIKLWCWQRRQPKAELGMTRAPVLGRSAAAVSSSTFIADQFNLKLVCQAILKGHTDDVSGFSQLGNGNLVSCDRDGIIRIWDLTSEDSGAYRCIRVLYSADGLSKGAMSVLGDGVTIVQACLRYFPEDRHHIRMWDTSAGTTKTVRNVTSYYGADRPFVRCAKRLGDDDEDYEWGDESSLGVLPDGVTVLTTSGGSRGIHLWKFNVG
jgi:WD40 repeat protein